MKTKVNKISTGITLIFLIIFALQTHSLTCGGNCPSNSCSSCWCGEKPSIISISDECKKYNWDQRCCQCILSKESGGNQNSMYQVNNVNSKTGLWQLDDNVRIITCSLKRQDKTSLCQKDINMACAYKLYQLNQFLGGWNNWKKSAHQCNCLQKSITL